MGEVREERFHTIIIQYVMIQWLINGHPIARICTAFFHGLGFSHDRVEDVEWISLLMT